MTNRLFAIILLLLIPFCVVAQGDTQSELRINPLIEQGRSSDYSTYTFIDHQENKIEMNGDDWSALKQKFAAAIAGDTLFSVVYLGDSHIQADFGGDVVRNRLWSVSPAAGRGIVIPFKSAGTNNPLDYTISLNEEYKSSRLLKMPWATDMPFTGIGIEPKSETCTYTVTCQKPFDRMRFIFRGDTVPVLSASSSMNAIDCSKGLTSIEFGDTVSSASIVMTGAHTLAGVELLNGKVGTVLHSIGNNGATYGTYNQIDNFAEELSQLSPDLVIVALGTNEAFNRAGAEEVSDEIDMLMKSMARAMPDAKFMMVAPSECMKKKYAKKKRRASNLIVNPKVLTIRNTIKDYAQDHNIPLYDHYAAAGGKGAAAKMQKAGVLGRDGVHFTAVGYRLWGDLMADALLIQLLEQ